MHLTYASVCSGIESASVAWEPLGMKPVRFSEIEPFPCAVLKRHWPHVYNWGDFTKIPARAMRGCADILVGGTPCQAFSVAGKRLSLEDARGNLTLEFCRIADEMDPRIVVWENVPGVLTTSDNAFGCFLSALCGNDEVATPTEYPLEQEINRNAKPPRVTGPKSPYWRWDKDAKDFVSKWPTRGAAAGPARRVAWRVLDAQFFGVAQRRRRVFVVASARADIDPSKILFEYESVRRDSPPSRETWKETAGETGSGFKTGSHWDGHGYPHPTLGQSFNTGGIGASNQEIFSQRGSGIVGALDTECGYGSPAFQSVLVGHILGGYRRVAFGEYADDETGSTLCARDYKDAKDLCVSVHGTQDPCVGVERAHALGRNNGGENAVLAHGIPGNWIGRAPGNGGNATEPMREVAPCQTVTDRHGVSFEGKVRRLTPVECERLQGFPDGHTLIPYGVKAKLDLDTKTYLEAHLGRGLTADEAAAFCGDGPRYKALGNSKAVLCVRWLGMRIIKHLRGEL